MNRQPEARQRPAKAFPAGDPNSKKIRKKLFFLKISKVVCLFAHSFTNQSFRIWREGIGANRGIKKIIWGSKWYKKKADMEKFSEK
jgi:hypothetical protein